MTAVLEHFLTNKKFKEYAERYGTVIDGDNYKATALEFEHLLEQVVQICAFMVENSSHKSTDQIAADIMEFFEL